MPRAVAVARASAVRGRTLLPSVVASMGVVGALLLSDYRCPFHAVTGWYCPGCGGTRAVIALLHGDVFLALRDNLLAVTLFPMAMAVGIVKPARITAELQRHRMLVFVLAVIITWAFTMLRNTIAPGLAPA